MTINQNADFVSDLFYLGCLLWSLKMVEAAGIEPASANPPPLVLHV